MNLVAKQVVHEENIVVKFITKFLVILDHT